MKYGLRFVPRVGQLDAFGAAVARSMKQVNLAHVSKIEMKFDPFSGKAAESLRTFAFHIDTPSLRSTNYKASIKLNIVSDRSEPMMNVHFNNGDKAVFKTANLNAKEVAEEFNVLCDIHEMKSQQDQSKKKRR